MKPWRSFVAVIAASLTASCAAVWGFDDAVLADASAPDVTSLDLLDASAEADVTAGPVVDATRDTAPAAVDAAGAPVCSPACGVGYSCASAVGGAPVCVASQGTCTDSTGCSFSGCCVWTDSASATGRCQAPSFVGASSSVSCLCTGKQTDPARPMCKTCAAPASDPKAPVLVCSSG